MNYHEKLTVLMDAENKLLECVTSLSKLEREIIKQGDSLSDAGDILSDIIRGRLFKLSPGDITQLEEGYTITVIGNGVAIRLQMKEDYGYHNMDAKMARPDSSNC